MSPGELVIPDEAYEAGKRAALGVSSDVLRAAAPLIVAGELTRLADELEKLRLDMREADDGTIGAVGLGEALRRMRARADELRDAAS